MASESKGKVQQVFKDRIGDLVDQATSIAAGIRQTGQRLWQLPTDWEGSPQDIASMTQPFDRTELGNNYEELLADGEKPGTIGDVICVKTQGDYLAMMERAFRARHASPIRCLAHAAAARNGHGHAKGVFQGGIMKYVEDSLQAGSQ